MQEQEITRGKKIFFALLMVFFGAALVIGIGYGKHFDTPPDSKGKLDSQRAEIEKRLNVPLSKEYAAEQDSIAKKQAAGFTIKLAKASKLAEQEFFSKVAIVDKEGGSNYTAEIKKVLKTSDRTLYMLYDEIKGSEKLVVEEAKRKAKSLGYKEDRYYNFADEVSLKYMKLFMYKYKMSQNLYICFENNYKINLE